MNRPDPAATRAHWNALADGYDEAKARRQVYHQTLKELLRECLGPAARRRVLDVGCGTGQLLAHLDPEAGVGVDASRRMIERAASRFADRSELTFTVMDATEVGDLEPFDAVFSCDLLEHVPDWRAVVDAMMRACKSGGTLVVTTPSPKWALPLWLLEKLRLKMPEGPHAFVAGRAIAAHLEALGCPVRLAGTRLLVPAHVWGLGRRGSDLAARLPVLRGLGVIQVIVAEKGQAFGGADCPRRESDG